MADFHTAQRQQQALTEVINAIGSAGLARCLAKLVNTYVMSDCCVILSYQASGAALYLYDDLTTQRELLFSQYLNGLYAQDPFYRALRQGLTDGVYSLNKVLVKAGASAPEYLAGFYQATGWQQELGLVITLHPGQWLTLFLGRLCQQAFTVAEQDALQQLLPLLSALCRQHWPKGATHLAQTPSYLPTPTSSLLCASQQSASRSMEQRVQQALASFAQSRLTRREQQVARALLQGLDNGAIARQLAIGEGTVKNHRKQVYRKLAIDSQSALFARFINHLITYDSASSIPCPVPSALSNLRKGRGRF